MNKELVKHFIKEYKEDKEQKKRWKANHIDFNDFFKYSGYIEETQEIVREWIYFNNDPNNIKRSYGTNILHDFYVKAKKKENDKNKSVKNRRTKEGFEFMGEK